MTISIWSPPDPDIDMRTQENLGEWENDSGKGSEWWVCCKLVTTVSI